MYLCTWNLSKFKVHLSNQTIFIKNMYEAIQHGTQVRKSGKKGS